MKLPILFVLLISITQTFAESAMTSPSAPKSTPHWQARAATEAIRLGHRNMILVADSAYPIQTGTGVKVIETNADHLTVLHMVLEAVEKAPGVRPLIAIDKEFAWLPEEYAPGAAALRKEILTALPKGEIREELHENLLKEVNETSESYEIVVFKTLCTIPYSSVFITLDCGYWSAEAEAALRKRMSENP